MNIYLLFENNTITIKANLVYIYFIIYFIIRRRKQGKNRVLKTMSKGRMNGYRLAVKIIILYLCYHLIEYAVIVILLYILSQYLFWCLSNGMKIRLCYNLRTFLFELTSPTLMTEIQTHEKNLIGIFPKWSFARNFMPSNTDRDLIWVED